MGITTVTPEECMERIDHWASEYPEIVTRYWQLRGDEDQCPCCIQAELVFEFGDVAWRPWLSDFERAIFLLGEHG